MQRKKSWSSTPGWDGINGSEKRPIPIKYSQDNYSIYQIVKQAYRENHCKSMRIKTIPNKMRVMNTFQLNFPASGGLIWYGYSSTTFIQKKPVASYFAELKWAKYNWTRKEGKERINQTLHAQRVLDFWCCSRSIDIKFREILSWR